jgi:murein DD-endopeptidase MepM/ murein hydrolase activator NlpD
MLHASSRVKLGNSNSTIGKRDEQYLQTAVTTDRFVRKKSSKPSLGSYQNRHLKKILLARKRDQKCGAHCPAAFSSTVLKIDNSPWLRNAMAILFAFLLLPFSAQASHPEKLIKVSTAKDGVRTIFYVDNLQATYVTVTFEMELANLSCTHEIPCTITFPPRSHSEAFSLAPKVADKDSSWSYTYYATWGRLDVVHDDSAVYILPFAVGTAYPVSQGYEGTFSHTGGDRYSIDFRMPVGTPVHCARDGEVVGVKDDSDTGGPEKKFEWDANYVLVRHSDGTLGHYVHLMKGGCRVKVGQRVKAGDWIALSGNTGFTTGPHLHFAVFKAHDGKNRETIPVRYRTFQAADAISLKEGQVYTAVMPSSALRPAAVPVEAVTTTVTTPGGLPEAAGKPHS